MRTLFYLGWVLVICAFVAAAAEQLVRVYPGGAAILTPAYDLWYTLWPGGLTVTQIKVERLSPWLWDPAIKTVLAVPAWFLIGAPGVVLAWFCRPGRVMTRSERVDYQKHAESLFLYDELAKEAKAEGYAVGPDDMSPDHGGHDTLDAADLEPVPTDDELREEIMPPAGSPNGQRH